MSRSLRIPARLVPVAAALLLTACATVPRQQPPVSGVIATNPRVAESLGAPRVSIATEYEYGTFRQIRTRLRVTDDAYVLVVNVSPDGATRILFPESPKDNGLLLGGKSYLLPHFFGGYPSMSLELASSSTRFVRVGQSALANPKVKGPGYTFALASRTPFDMQRLEDEGFFDWAEVGSTLNDLDPDVVIPTVAEIALAGGGNFIASSDVARYAGYDPMGGSAAPVAFARGVTTTGGCSAQLLMEWPYLSTRPIPEACYQNWFPRRVQVTPRPALPPVDVPTDSAGTPSDSGATNPEEVERRPRPRPVDGGIGAHRDRAIELDRYTREQMIRSEKLESRRLERDGHIGVNDDGVRRRPRARSAVDSDRPQRRERREQAPSPRSSSTASGSTASEPSSSSSSSGSSSGSSSSNSSGASSSGSSRPASQLPGRPN